ncbi:MAG: (deoxy)nucleoside triphosphate pyrophosphohydrolase [Parasphingorhabdus sp.]
MEKNPTLLFVVAAALVNERDEVLVQKRPEGKPMAGLWEFPGGKVEPGERPEDALVRELLEELNIKTTPCEFEPITFASEPLGSRSLLLLLYRCRKWSGQLESLESAVLQWTSLSGLKSLKMPPADGPLVDKLIEFSL